MTDKNNNEDTPSMEDPHNGIETGFSDLANSTDEELMADFSQWSEYAKSSPPDGIMDASGYVETVNGLIAAISRFESLSSEEERSHLLILLVKAASSSPSHPLRSLDGIIGLAYLLTVMLSSLDDIEQGHFDTFKNYLNGPLREQLEGNVNVPYWEHG